MLNHIFKLSKISNFILIIVKNLIYVKLVKNISAPANRRAYKTKKIIFIV